jgi:hypothetical protein
MSAPWNDLQQLQQLISNQAANETIAKAAVHSFSNHSWYLNKMLVGLALFDSAVSDNSKIAMVAALKLFV